MQDPSPTPELLEQPQRLLAGLCWLEEHQQLQDTHQVGHDNGIHDDRAGGGAQGELQPPRWLPSCNVIAVSLQQQVLQLILCSHNTVHLKGADTADCSTGSKVPTFSHSVTL